MASIFEVLIVAGGGSGGQHTTTNGNGGGGAGGVLYGTAIDLSSTTNYTVSVGAGGAAVTSNANGNKGTNSYISSFVAIGGGGGGGSGVAPSSSQMNGGSGGGYAIGNGGGGAGGISIQTAPAGFTAYGNRGSIGAITWTGGGGGGAGTVGVDGSNNANGGNGGQGVPFSITGTQKYYAGGGGGGGNSSERAGDGYHGGGRGAGTTSYYNYNVYTNEVNATTLGSGTPNGIANTGGGGGGGSYWASNGGWSSGSGAGGSGIIVIKYPDTYGLATVTGSPTVTNPTGYRVYQFTSSGTFQPPYTGPENTVLPVVTGTLEVGQTLSVDTGTWSAPATPTFAYQWKRAGVAISGATANTYTTVSADGDTNITCTVTATESGVTGTATTINYFVVAPTSRYMEYLLVAGGGGGGTKIGGGGGGGGLLHANALAPNDGDAEFTTPGTYSWVCPAGVTSVSVVCVGGGGGGGYQWSSGGGGGGGLGWKNAIPVTPGTAYTVVVGAGGPSLSNAYNSGTEGGNSYFIDLNTVAGYGSGRGGPTATAATPAYGGGFAGDGGGRGGNGAYDGSWTRAGAGAGGYSGRGADAEATSTGTSAPTGSGGGAAGGYYSSTYGVPAGGGVGLYGRGADGVARGQYLGGGGGSGGGNGVGGEGSGESSYKGITGGQYGGGGGGSGTSYGGGAGGGGAVRIIWGGGRSFPTNAPQSTNTLVSPPLVQKGLYTVIVGAGGAGASAGTTNAGAQGGNTSFAGLVAIGGGGGGSRNDANTSPATTGGSGGGANGYTGAVGAVGTAGQGRKGGNSGGTGYAGGGGGAGTVGGTGTAAGASAGGDGLADTILTTSYYWGGGGGGSGYSVAGGNGGLGGGGGGAVGTTTGGTTVPYANSLYFDGNGDYLTAPSNAAFAFGTGDFTVEFWFNVQGAGDFAQQHVFQTRDGAGNGLLFQYDRTNKNFSIVSDTGLSGLTTSNNTINDSTWYHIALTRSGTTIYFFVNGVQIATTTSAQDFNSSTPYISRRFTSDGYLHYFNGYISNLHMVKGTAVYTSAFTPSTVPLTAITNTVLLTAQTTNIIDRSTNNFTLTAYGDLRTSSQNPFSLNNYSGYFNGTDSYLTLSSSAATNITTGAYTIEFWINQPTIVTGYVFGATTSAGRLTGRVSASTVAIIDAGGTNSFTVPTFIANTWYHIAIVRDALSNTTVFVNGTRSSTGSISITTSYTALNRVGAHSTSYFSGYISNFRVVTGKSLYDPTQTTAVVPFSPLTAIPGTSLLTCQNSTFIDNSTNNYTITAVGGSQIATQNPFISVGANGGGGALNTSANTSGGAGGAGTGGGGGGGSLGTATNAGGNGGGGAVILRYPDTKNAALYATNLDSGYPVVTGGYRIYKWSGSGTIQFGATGGPALVVAPAITVTSGSVTNGLAGAVLTCGTGTWQGDATIVYTYQWYSNGVIKAGETANTYTTLLSDAFKTLTCKVTATNSADTLTVDTSNGMNILINGFVSVRNDYGFGVNQAVAITDSSQTTLAESSDFTITNTITDGNEKLTRQEVVISTTYSASDNTPVTQGTGTGAAGPTQSWYIG